MSKDLGEQAESILSAIQLYFHQITYEQKISPVSSMHSLWDKDFTLELNWPLESHEERLADRIFACIKVSARSLKRGKWEFRFLTYAHLPRSVYQGRACLDETVVEYDLAKGATDMCAYEMRAIIRDYLSKHRIYDGDPGILLTDSWFSG
jgi:hypothetical protein